MAKKIYREKVVTLNIDFNRSLDKQTADIRTASGMGPSVILVQEARDTYLRRILPNGWDTNQVVSSKDKRGSAVCWDADVWSDRNRVSKLVFGVRGRGINPRWISIQNLQHKETARVIRFVSLHIPPRGRVTSVLQAPMVNALVAVVKRTKRDLVVGGDFNFIMEEDKYNVSKRTGLVKRHGKIDGFFVSKRLKPGLVERGPDVNSPHHPVAVTIEVA